MNNSSSANNKIYFATITIVSFIVLLAIILQIYKPDPIASPFLYRSQQNNIATSKSTYHKKAGVMTYIYNSPESENDIRYNYQWEILKTALEKTQKQFGAFEMIKAKSMTEKRQ